MNLIRCTIFAVFVFVWLSPINAWGDDERAERRETRERREEIRVALKRVQKCFASGEVDCFDKEDQSMRTALLGVYLRFLEKNPKATQDFLKGK